MAITSFTQTPISASLWRLNFTSDDPDAVFRIGVDGVLVGTTQNTYWDVAVSPGEHVIVEVYDDNTAFVATYPGRVTLAWDAVENAAYYSVEEYVDAEWVVRQEVPAQVRKTHYTWPTRYLEDVTDHQFRVRPFGENGLVGYVRSFNFKMVRYPDPATVAFSYDSGTGEITATVT